MIRDRQVTRKIHRQVPQVKGFFPLEKFFAFISAVWTSCGGIVWNMVEPMPGIITDNK
jgi:hypothetical protein